MGTTRRIAAGLAAGTSLAAGASAAAQDGVVNDIGFSAEFGGQYLYGEFDSQFESATIGILAAVVRLSYEAETPSKIIPRIALELEGMTGISEGDADSSVGSGVFRVDQEADVRLKYSAGLFTALHTNFSPKWGGHLRAGLTTAETEVTTRNTLGVETETTDTSFAPALGGGLKRRLGNKSSLRLDATYYWFSDEYIGAALTFRHTF